MVAMRPPWETSSLDMPTLVRLLCALALLATLTVAAMAALVYFVEPRRAEIVIDVPLPGLQPELEPGDTLVPLD